MPFSGLSQSTSERLFDAQKTLSLIQRADEQVREKELDSASFHALKGLFYVTLYAVVEHCVSGIVERLLEEVERLAIPANKLKPGLASVSGAPLFQSAADLASLKKFAKRHEIVAYVTSSNPAEFSQGVLADECMSASGDSIGALWLLLELPASPFSTRERAIFNEIFERRCAVAHGRETVSEVGSKFTVKQLEDRLKLVQTTTSDWLASASSALTSKAYYVP
jgi:hypothetical protein